MFTLSCTSEIFVNLVSNMLVLWLKLWYMFYMSLKLAIAVYSFASLTLLFEKKTLYIYDTCI